MIKNMLNTRSLHSTHSEPQHGGARIIANHNLLSQNCFLRPQTGCPTGRECSPKYPPCRKAHVPFTPLRNINWSSDVGGTANDSTPSKSPVSLRHPPAGRRRAQAQPCACLLDRAKDLLPPLLSTRGCSRASQQTDSSWRRSGALFKMIRRHRGRGCSLGDVDCLGLNLASRDRIQSRQFRTLRRLFKRQAVSHVL
jgi:hypothetical protein